MSYACTRVGDIYALAIQSADTLNVKKTTVQVQNVKLLGMLEKAIGIQRSICEEEVVERDLSRPDQREITVGISQVVSLLSQDRFKNVYNRSIFDIGALEMKTLLSQDELDTALLIAIDQGEAESCAALLQLGAYPAAGIEQIVKAEIANIVSDAAVLAYLDDFFNKYCTFENHSEVCILDVAFAKGDSGIIPILQEYTPPNVFTLFPRRFGPGPDYMLIPVNAPQPKA